MTLKIGDGPKPSSAIQAGQEILKSVREDNAGAAFETAQASGVPEIKDNAFVPTPAEAMRTAKNEAPTNLPPEGRAQESFSRIALEFANLV